MIEGGVRQIPLAQPVIGERERELVEQVLSSDVLALGPFAERFEEGVAEMAGRRFGISCSSGTAGLHMAVRALGIADGDEVITTPFSFVASANCLLYERARPVFVDIEEETLGLDPNRVEAASGPRTVGILPVHVFGRPCPMPAYNAIAARRGLAVIEDSCEAIGSTIDGRKAGTFGRAGIFAFYPNKQMTTGEGGIVVTDDAALAALLSSLRNQGRGADGNWLAHERLGWNYRIPDILCALGLVQLERLEEFVAARQHVVDLYARHLGGIEELVLPPPAAPGQRISWFVYVIALSPQHTRENRDALLEHLRTRGIGCRNYFSPIHLQPFYRERFGLREGMFPVTESVASRTIALPFFNRLGEAAVVRVKDALAEFFARR